MLFCNDTERQNAVAIGKLNYTNPFMPERLELEKEILGRSEALSGPVWSRRSSREPRRNISRLQERAAELTASLHRRLEQADCRATEAELAIYAEVALYHLFEAYRSRMTPEDSEQPFPDRFEFYREFLAEFQRLLHFLPAAKQQEYTPERTFAIFFQIHRAFFYIFEFIIGSTLQAGQLRAAIWQSIFSCDIHRYNRSLYAGMQDITTLITGESGTGKELVARAITFSQYIPFDPATLRFQVNFQQSFHPIHLSAMPKTMLESELFGHHKGAFTGAYSDRLGRLEICTPYDSVFLDEIGEIDEEIQVKLLRLLQNRRFQRLGENEDRHFPGKIIAATNRDLAAAIAERRFRADLYYRLCADVIVTPPLRQMIGRRRGELENFVSILSKRLLGPLEAERFTAPAVDWIVAHLGFDYPWPGNVRELEQCIRNLLIRGSYTPAGMATAEGGQSERLLETCNLSAEQLLARYAALLYRRTGNCQRVAAIMQLDRRTVKRLLDVSARA